MPVRALFSSFLLALIVATSVCTAPAAAKTKPVTAKIALGAKKKAKKKVKKKKAKRAAARSTAAKRPARPAAAPPAAPAECAGTTLVPDAGNLDLIRAALVCLHNQIRAQSGLGALGENGALAAAAAGHSEDMLRRGYFAHDTPEGGTFVDRIIAARYAGRDAGWTLGENLAWGTGELSTPAGLMRSWMNSPGHRDNILRAAYREFGLGLRLGTPTGAGSGITVSAEFGARLV